MDYSVQRSHANQLAHRQIQLRCRKAGVISVPFVASVYLAAKKESCRKVRYITARPKFFRIARHATACLQCDATRNMLARSPADRWAYVFYKKSSDLNKL